MYCGDVMHVCGGVERLDEPTQRVAVHMLHSFLVKDGVGVARESSMPANKSRIRRHSVLQRNLSESDVISEYFHRPAKHKSVKACECSDDRIRLQF